MNAVNKNMRLRNFMLQRLQATAEKRREKAREIAYLSNLGLLDGPEGEDYKLQSRLLDKAIYSMYLDCLEAGASSEARELLGELRQATATAS